MERNKLAEWSTSPAAFREQLQIPSAYGPRRFGQVMAEFQRERFAKLDDALKAVAVGQKPAIGRHWWEATKGASKDSDLAVCLLWLLAFSRRSLTCQVGAADADQADELRKAAKGILRLNGWLAEVVTMREGGFINQRTGSECTIIPADIAGSHGARPDVLVLNELSHVSKREFAENLMDNAAKVPNGIVVIATNAGFQPSWQYDWRETARTSDRWSFSQLAEPAPWIDADELFEARKRNSASRYARLWQGQWVSGAGDAFEPRDIDDAFVLDGPMPPTPGYAYFAGLDIGLKRDHSGLVLLGKHIGYRERQLTVKEPAAIPDTLAAMIDAGLIPAAQTTMENDVWHEPTYRLRLVQCKTWKPTPGERVSVERIEEYILKMHADYRIAGLHYDPHQAEFLAERLKRQGVPVTAVPFTSASWATMTTALCEALTERALDLYRDPLLEADLRAARIIETNKRLRLQFPRDEHGHGDRATALCLALLGAQQNVRGWQSTRLERPIVGWPALPQICGVDYGD